MRYLARRADGTPLLGDEEGFVPLGAALPGVDSVRGALPLAVDGLPDPGGAPAERVPADRITFGPPLAEPGELLGIGLNYADHAADLDEDAPDEPASFLKPAAAATGPGGPIRLPPPDVSDRVTAEAELAVVIGRTCSDLADGAADADAGAAGVAEGTADDAIAGYLPVIDVTAEDVLQRNPRFLTRAKSFDTFLVMGPHVAVPESPPDLADVEVRTVVDGAVRARNVVGNMHFSPRELVAFHSRVTTFQPGDVVCTGTPGAHVVEPGDAVRAEVDRFGSVAAAVVR